MTKIYSEGCDEQLITVELSQDVDIKDDSYRVNVEWLVNTPTTDQQDKFFDTAIASMGSVPTWAFYGPAFGGRDYFSNSDTVVLVK